MSESRFDRFRVIDTDTDVTEPPDVPEPALARVLHDNAARLYGID